MSGPARRNPAARGLVARDDMAAPPAVGEDRSCARVAEEERILQRRRRDLSVGRARAGPGVKTAAKITPTRPRWHPGWILIHRRSDPPAPLALRILIRGH